MATRTLSLVKDGHRYVFRYATGSEDAVLDEILRLAESADANFDWLDAATLSFQVTHYAATAVPGPPDLPGVPQDQEAE
jgi:hypothetical protein